MDARRVVLAEGASVAREVLEESRMSGRLEEDFTRDITGLEAGKSLGLFWSFCSASGKEERCSETLCFVATRLALIRLEEMSKH
jgi:hypothetical protein